MIKVDRLGDVYERGAAERGRCGNLVLSVSFEIWRFYFRCFRSSARGSL